MALERDYEAERLGRIDLLLVEGTQPVGKVALDRSVSERLGTRWGGEALKEWDLEWLTHRRRFP
jgi:hypothetical protein